MYLLGYDIGSSSVKAALVHAGTGEVAAVLHSPETEMEIVAPRPGWAEQDPASWWEHVCLATRKLLDHTKVKPDHIKGIGISYQMHGLVLVDRNMQVIRPSIIWCDSRAVDTGERAFNEIGRERCLSLLLNAPGNFTAAKWKWVKEHEPAVFEKTWKMMLPGDYIAMRLTGEVLTTPGGLSEGILWNFRDNRPADILLDHFGLPPEGLPDLCPAFSMQGSVSKKAAQETGLSPGTPVTYRSGDQPNNALSLNVFNPGEIAATGGTSGVVYGVTDKVQYDPQSRVNSFIHVNHTVEEPRIGILLCINGAGILYAWMKNRVGPAGLSYYQMEHMASGVPPGSDGLRIMPFGNGAERMLLNKNPGAAIRNLEFNRHSRAHLFRAALEGVAFSFVYGIGILRETGLQVQVMHAGNDNLFRSNIFSATIANLVNCRIKRINTTGAVGAARASGVASGFFSSPGEAMHNLEVVDTVLPDDNKMAIETAYHHWRKELEKLIGQPE